MQELYEARRRRFLESMGPRAVAVIPSAPVAVRNNDVEHEYRQDSDFFYLTGLDEPESVLILSTAHPDQRTVLFVRPRNPEREIWDGPRAGVEGAKADFGADVAFDVKDYERKLPDYLAGADTVFFRPGLDRAHDDKLFRGMDMARRRHRNRTAFPTAIVDPGTRLHEHRLIKSDEEVAIMRRAAEVSERAHRAALRLAAPGRYEFEVEAEILGIFRAAGCERPAYGPIVGSGPNATILHHRKNDRRMEDGDLLLIDAGCELEYYASDVTRTFPVNGRFTRAQRAIYDLVLKAERTCVAAAKPGADLDAIHELAVRVLTEGLVALGLVTGPLDEAIAEERYKPFYMHRTSHWLGMDVHDVGLYYVDGKPRPLEPGMVFTIEPGLYIGVDADVDPAYRGIGVRIEDDILVTEAGRENLTESIPSDPDEIESLMSTAAAAE
ncbi:MAG: Xaa-Pro aminopeptidase [Sandaracinaceae bacterium]